MKPELIKATDLRVKTREIMERVKYKGEIFLVQTFGQPTAIIIGVEEYNLLQREIKELKEKIVGSSCTAQGNQKTP